jgi:hypothetical protein
MPYNSLTMRFPDKRVIRWIFQYEHDFNFMTSCIVPWAIPQGTRVDNSGDADFVIAVYAHDPSQMFSNQRSPYKFILAAEVESRFNYANAISIVSGPQSTDDTSSLRYGPTMCCWSPPMTGASKTKICSAIENGNYSWRVAQVLKAQWLIPEMEIFGRLGNRPLGGYHCTGTGQYGNDKYLALRDFAFSMSIERTAADDYLTEKITDPIMCETVPIYRGATNLWEYFIPEAVILLDEIHTINWSDWQSVYLKMLPYIKHQKEILRTRFNIFSYFEVLTRDLSLLNHLRPITITRPSCVY